MNTGWRKTRSNSADHIFLDWGQDEFLVSYYKVNKEISWWDNDITGVCQINELEKILEVAPEPEKLKRLFLKLLVKDL